MYFADLTPHTYCDSDGPVGVNIGWLEKGHTFETGPVPPGLVDRLEEICETPCERHRGFQVCRFCNFERIPGSSNLEATNEIIKKAEDSNALSSTVICVTGSDGQVYYSPAMICHYISKHGYKPPEEFIKAVMKTELSVEQ